VAEYRPDVHFVLIGSGPQLALVEREVAELRLGASFHHLPAVPTAALVLSQLDVLVNPSRFEGLPYTPLEAVRAGTPIVLSDAVGNRDVIEDGVSGFVRPVGDATAMGDAVVLLLHDEALGRSLTEAARRRLARRFDVRDMGLATAEQYALVVDDVRSGGRRASMPDAIPEFAHLTDEEVAQVVAIHRSASPAAALEGDQDHPADVIEFRRPLGRGSGRERRRNRPVESKADEASDVEVARVVGVRREKR
jgi:hypothetical protein